MWEKLKNWWNSINNECRKSNSVGKKTAIGIAHSKVILIGEHAVVHGQPAIAIPFPLIGVETVIEYVPGAVKMDSTFYHGPLKHAPKELEGIVECVSSSCEYLGSLIKTY